MEKENQGENWLTHVKNGRMCTQR